MENKKCMKPPTSGWRCCVLNHPISPTSRPSRCVPPAVPASGHLLLQRLDLLAPEAHQRLLLWDLGGDETSDVWSVYLGNGHFLTTVVNFGFRTFWADLTLLCVKMCRFFWAEIPGKRAEIPVKRAEIPGQTQHDLKLKTWSGKFFLDMVIVILKWTNLQKMDRNQTKICPGKKFVWISRYVH